MKIPVRDENQSVLGATAVKIKDLSSGLQKVTVRALKKRIRIPVKYAEEVAPETYNDSQTSTDTNTQTKKRKRKLRTFLPSLPKGRPSFKKIARRTALVTGAAALTVGGIYYVTAPSDISNPGEIKGSMTSTASQSTPLVYETPSFPTLLPKGRTIKQLGGWVRMSPPEQDPVYAYTDTIGATHIRVTQQRMPDNFSDDPVEEVEQVVQDFGPTQKLTVGNTTVHIGTNASGPQSVIFTKEDLLVFIKSNDPIPDNKWSAYIQSLQ